MPEPSTVTRTTLEVLGSFFVAGAKVVALLLGLVVTWNLTLGRNWSGVTETAEQAIMWSDLRNLERAQEIHFVEFGSFGTSLSELEFRSSPGVTIELALGAERAWSAVASYSHVPMQCAIFVGSIKPPLPGGEEGYPVCQESP